MTLEATASISAPIARAVVMADSAIDLMHQNQHSMHVKGLQGTPPADDSDNGVGSNSEEDEITSVMPDTEGIEFTHENPIFDLAIYYDNGSGSSDDDGYSSTEDSAVRTRWLLELRCALRSVGHLTLPDEEEMLLDEEVDDELMRPNGDDKDEADKLAALQKSLEGVLEHRMKVAPEQTRRSEKRRKYRRKLKERRDRANKQQNALMNEGKHDSAVITSGTDDGYQSSGSESDTSHFRILDAIAAQAVASSLRVRENALDAALRSMDIPLVLPPVEPAKPSLPTTTGFRVEMLDKIMSDLDIVRSEFEDMEAQLLSSISAKTPRPRSFLLALSQQADIPIDDLEIDRLDGHSAARSSPEKFLDVRKTVKYIASRDTLPLSRRESFNSDSKRTSILRNPTASRESLRVDTGKTFTVVPTAVEHDTEPLNTPQDEKLPQQYRPGSPSMRLVAEKIMNILNVTVSSEVEAVEDKELPPRPPSSARQTPVVPAKDLDDDDDSIFDGHIPRRKSVSGISKAFRMMGMTEEEEVNALRRSIATAPSSPASRTVSMLFTGPAGPKSAPLDDSDDSDDSILPKTRPRPVSTAKALKLMGADTVTSPISAEMPTPVGAFGAKRSSALTGSKSFSRRLGNVARPNSVVIAKTAPAADVTSASSKPSNLSSAVPQPQRSASTGNPSGLATVAASAAEAGVDSDEELFNTGPSGRRKGTTINKAHKLMGITAEEMEASDNNSNNSRGGSGVDPPKTPVSARPMSLRRKSVISLSDGKETTTTTTTTTATPDEPAPASENGMPTVAELTLTATFSGTLSHHMPKNPFRPWKRLHHMLAHSRLYYFRGATPTDRAIGFIPINIRTDAATARAPAFKGKNVVAITGEVDGVQRGWYLMAETEDEKKEFMGAVVDVIMASGPRSAIGDAPPSLPVPPSVRRPSFSTVMTNSTEPAPPIPLTLPTVKPAASGGGLPPTPTSMLMSPIFGTSYSIDALAAPLVPLKVGATTTTTFGGTEGLQSSLMRELGMLD